MTASDDASHDPRGLPTRVGEAHRRPRADRARRRARRGARAGRARRRARAVAASRASRTTPAPGSWPPRRTARSTRCADGSMLDAQARAARPRGRRGRAGAPSRTSRRALDDDIGDDLLRLVLTACHPVLLDRGAGRAHAPAARRAHDRGDRARVPRPRADDRAADRAREADARRGAGAVRGAARRGARAAPRVGARGHLPHLQRGLLGDRGRRRDAPRALRGRAPPRAHPRGARAATSRRCTGSSRSWSCKRRARRRAPTPSGEPVLLLDQNRGLWDRVRFDRGLAALARAQALGGGARPVHAAGGDRRVPRARAHARRRPTGRGSRRSTASSPRSRRRRSSSSTARSPSRWRDGPAAGLALVDASDGRAARSRATTSCRARARDLLAKLGRMRRSGRGVRARGVAHAQRAPAGTLARARGGVPRGAAIGGRWLVRFIPCP